MATPAQAEAIVRNGLVDLHKENPGRGGNFTHDEIALSAIVHHDRYMKWYGRARQVLGWVGVSLSERPARVPAAFKMPTVSEGLMRIKSRGDLMHEHTGDVRTFTTREGETKHNLSNSTLVYGLTEEAKIKAGILDGRSDVLISAAHNGDGPIADADLPPTEEYELPAVRRAPGPDEPLMM